MLISIKHARIALDQTNPKLEGSKSWARYEAYKFAGTIGEFVNCGGTRADLANDFSRGYLRVPELTQILSLHTPNDRPTNGGGTSEATLATIERLRKRIQQSQTPGSPPPPASVFYELGLCLEKTGDLCEAMKSFKSAILAPSARPFSSMQRRGSGTGAAASNMGGTMALLEAAEAVEKHVENVEAVKAVEQAIVEEKAEEAETARNGGELSCEAEDARGVKRHRPYGERDTHEPYGSHAHSAYAEDPYNGYNSYGGFNGGGHGATPGNHEHNRRSSADVDDSYIRATTNYDDANAGGAPYGYGAHPTGYPPMSYPPRGYSYGYGYDARDHGYGYSYGYGDERGYHPREEERYRYTDRAGGLETRERSPYDSYGTAGEDSYGDRYGERGYGEGAGGHDDMSTTSSGGRGDGYSEAGSGKRRRSMKRTVSRQNSRGGRWTPEEHELFLKGKAIHGRSWTKVAEVVGTRTTVQVRSHAQKYEIKVQREKGELDGSAGEGSLDGRSDEE